MIDNEKLNKAYAEDRIYSLQLEIGDQCHQGCSYCYMNAVGDARNTLDDPLVRQILDDAATLGITAIEWLGGEPLLREGLFRHMALAQKRGLKNNLWTGGLPLQNPDILEQCAHYTENGLISVHVSSVNPDVYKILHPNRPEQDLAIILKGVEQLLNRGYPASQMLNSVTFTGKQDAGDMIATIDFFEHQYGIQTSLNVYHTYLRPDQTKDELQAFIPEPENVIRVYRRYAQQYGRRVCPMNCVNLQYCSATLAVLCDGKVTPCATIREKQAPNVHQDGRLTDIFEKNRDHLIFKRMKSKVNRPEDCRECPLSDDCWGCRSRSYASGYGLYGKDPRCFRIALSS
jgi:radical SAM protein with 4Fe4S-binding SPASM domain